MRNALFAAFVLMIGVATSPASAQQPAAGAAAQPASAALTGALTPDDLAALTDARVTALKLGSDERIAALKAGLKLRLDQEKNWATFESTVRDLAKQRQDRVQQVASAPANPPAQSADAIALLRRRADLMVQASANLKKFADGLEPLYKSLDDGQKRRMLILVATLR